MGYKLIDDFWGYWGEVKDKAVSNGGTAIDKIGSALGLNSSEPEQVQEQKPVHSADDISGIGETSNATSGDGSTAETQAMTQNADDISGIGETRNATGGDGSTAQVQASVPEQSNAGSQSNEEEEYYPPQNYETGSGGSQLGVIYGGEGAEGAEARAKREVERIKKSGTPEERVALDIVIDQGLELNEDTLELITGISKSSYSKGILPVLGGEINYAAEKRGRSIIEDQLAGRGYDADSSYKFDDAQQEAIEKRLQETKKNFDKPDFIENAIAIAGNDVMAFGNGAHALGAGFLNANHAANVRYLKENPVNPYNQLGVELDFSNTKSPLSLQYKPFPETKIEDTGMMDNVISAGIGTAVAKIGSGAGFVYTGVKSGGEHMRESYERGMDPETAFLEGLRYGFTDASLDYGTGKTLNYMGLSGNTPLDFLNSITTNVIKELLWPKKETDEKQDSASNRQGD